MVILLLKSTYPVSKKELDTVQSIAHWSAYERKDKLREVSLHAVYREFFENVTCDKPSARQVTHLSDLLLEKFNQLRETKEDLINSSEFFAKENLKLANKNLIQVLISSSMGKPELIAENLEMLEKNVDRAEQPRSFLGQLTGKVKNLFNTLSASA